MSENTKLTSKVGCHTSANKQQKTCQNNDTNLNIKVGASAVAGAAVGAAGTYFAKSTIESGESEMSNPNEILSNIGDMLGLSDSSDDVVIEDVTLSDNEIVQPVSAEPSSDDIQCIEVTVDGTTVYFADLDNDGLADVAVSDVNLNGIADENEVVDISEENILMAEVAEFSQEASSQASAGVNYASVRVDGVTYEVADVNQDGVADYVAADLNNNGVIDNDEIGDIQSENILMADLTGDCSSSYCENNQMAYNDTDLPDYTNDANVDEFMA